MIRKFAVLVTALGLVPLAGCGVEVSNPEIGNPAPAYESSTLDGQRVSLEDYRGKVVLLNAWATWCAPCREEIPALQALYDQRRGEGLEVIGVSVDARGEGPTIRRFAAEFGMTFPIWHDPDDRFALTFRTIGVPNTFLIDRDGVIRWRKLGPVDLADPSLSAALDAALGAGS
jgi:peroxiredoxin